MLRSLILIAVVCSTQFSFGQIQFEQVLPPLPAPQIMANIEEVSDGCSVFADVDGDSDQDFLHTGLNSLGQAIAELYLNDGIGNFAVVSDAPFEGIYSSSPSSIAFGDVDGDSDQDVLLTGLNSLGEFITKLYTNDGNGIFAEATETPFDEVWLSSIAFGDVDGDGDEDVVISGQDMNGQGTTNLYENDGDGIFTKVIGTPFQGVFQGSIAFADVDGDNYLDLLVTGSNTDLDLIAELYLNDGTGSFAISEGTPFQGVVSSDIAFSDVNGDGDQDVLITGYISVGYSTNLYLNDGSGNFTLSDSQNFDEIANGSVAFADIDGDGDADVLITGEINTPIPIAQLYLNDGIGIFTISDNSTFYGVAYSSVAFADIDGDGDQDVFITGLGNGYYSSKIYMNNGNVSFSEVTGSCFEGVVNGFLAFAELDGDTDQDVLMTGRNLQNDLIAKMYSNNGSGVYTPVSDTPFEGLEFGSVAFADVDGDQDKDVLITGFTALQSEVIKLYLNDGDAVFTEAVGTSLQGICVAFADIDGDGDEDLMTTGSSQSSDSTGFPIYNTKLYTNDGNGSFIEITGTPFVGVVDGSINFADFDGDDDLDVLITGFQNPFQLHSTLYANDGNGNFSQLTIMPFQELRVSSIAIADVAGDGDLDVLVTGLGIDDEALTILFDNDGVGNFTEVIGTPFEGVSSSASSFSDLDGDGDPDLLITGLNNNEQPITKLYSNEGNTTFIEVAELPFQGAYDSAIAFADIDGDGDQDVAITGNLRSYLYRNITNAACINCLDCFGDLNGTAYIDSCGTCVGGNTGEDPCMPIVFMIGGGNGNTFSSNYTFSIYEPNGNTPIGSANGTLESQSMTPVYLSVESGIYDVYIQLNGYLSTGLYGVTIDNESQNELIFGTLVAGDVVPNDVVDISDLTGLLASFNAPAGDLPNNSFPDLNQDSVVDISDLTILLANFGLVGDIPGAGE